MEGKNMSNEPTVEELQRKLIEAQRQNLEQQEELKKKEIDAEVEKRLKQLGYNSKSKLNEPTTQQSMNLTGNKDAMNFRARFIEQRNREGLEMSGKGYAEIMEDLKWGHYKNKKAPSIFIDLTTLPKPQ